MENSIDPTQAQLKFIPSALATKLERIVNDPRDLPFFETIGLISLVLLPFALSFYFYNFSWWLAPLYWITLIWFLGPFLLTLHLICHRKLFKKEHAWANRIIPWFIGPFFGQIPEAFYAHHVAMHHLENNMHADLSSTLKYRRDSFFHWLQYFLKFVFLGRLTLLKYIWQRKRMKIFWPLVFGLVFCWSLVVGLTFLNPRASVVVFYVPMAIAWFGLMAGNWTQHAFVDACDPNNPYKNSITVINAIYNKRCYNDGYHIGHHLKQMRHWCEMPEDFAANRESYIKNKSIIFNTYDYQILWIFLMLKRYDWLAKHFVDLNEPDKKMSQAEIIDLLKMRTAPVV